MIVKRFEKDGLMTYNFSSLDQLKNQVETWKKEFREKNLTDTMIKEKYYEKYCDELDYLIKNYAEG
jgi:predicted transcriptional regulator